MPRQAKPVKKAKKLPRAANTGRKLSIVEPMMDLVLYDRDEAERSAARFFAGRQSPVLELTERGDGDALFHVLADKRVDLRSRYPRTSTGDTPLHVAASQGQLKNVMALVGAGMPVDVLGHRLRTPLHCAAAHGHEAVVQRLLYAGANANLKDADGATAVELAVGKGHKAVVERFLNEGVSVDACNGDGEPLLVQAVKANCWAIVDLLLARGASATKCKANKECALVFASRDGQADAVGHLLSRGAASNTNQVKWALGEAKSAAVVWAFMNVVPNQVLGEAGSYGMREAACIGRLEPMGALLDAGVQIDNKCPITGNTALHRASANGHVKCVEELVRRGADVKVKNNQGKTPLQEAKTEEVRRAFNVQ